MTQKVDKYFGICLSIDKEIDKNEYAEHKEKLTQQLEQASDINFNNVEIYIHKLDLVIKPKYLKISPLEARLDKLIIDLVLNSKAKKSGQIWFLNPQPEPINPVVEVKYHKFRLSYSLTGKYCREHGGYSNYIAMVVINGCPQTHKELKVKATAYPTDRLKRKIIGYYDGMGKTNLDFPLTHDTKITFDL